MPDKNSTNSIIYKELEFDQFISVLEAGAVPHLKDIAQIVGVTPDTLTDWVRRPEAIEARIRGINKALVEMEKVGSRDWKMWREKARMLGLIDVEKTILAGDKNDPLTIEIVEQAKE